MGTSKLILISIGLVLLATCNISEAGRFRFQGPIVTVTLRDPYTSQQPQPQPAPGGDANINSNGEAGDRDGNRNGNENGAADTQTPESLPRKKRPWNRLRFGLHRNPSESSPFQCLSSLSPTILYAIRSINPLPNYFPALQSTSLTASYNYRDMKDKPNFIEGDMRLYSRKLGLDVDVGTSYNVQQNSAALAVRIGAMEDTSTATSTGTGTGSRGGGCFGMARFVLTQGKQYLQHVRAQYSINLPFAGVGSLAITPMYEFDSNTGGCTVVGYSQSGRTAAVLDLNLDRPTLSVKHALDQWNTIQPEISLWDAKILYNWNLALTGGSSIKTRVDPTEAIQVSWTDETRNGKWVTDFRLPLVSGANGNGSGALASDIRVRRQFVF